MIQIYAIKNTKGLKYPKVGSTAALCDENHKQKKSRQDSQAGVPNRPAGKHATSDRMTAGKSQKEAGRTECRVQKQPQRSGRMQKPNKVQAGDFTLVPAESGLSFRRSACLVRATKTPDFPSDRAPFSANSRVFMMKNAVFVEKISSAGNCCVFLQHPEKEVCAVRLRPRRREQETTSL